MSDARMIWGLFAPLLAGLVAALLLLLPPRSRPVSQRVRQWFDFAALLSACAGLLTQVALFLSSGDRAELPALGLALTISPLSRLGIATTSIALLCALFMSWSASPGEEARYRTRHVLSSVLMIMLTSSLLMGALLAADRLAQALFLFAAALPVTIMAALPLPDGLQVGKLEGLKIPAPNLPTSQLSNLPTRMVGGLKQLSMSGLGTILLIAGALMLTRYPLNLEKTATLQIGLGLLAVGLAVRAGVMPFGGVQSDLVKAAPQAAIVLLGAITPSALIVGLGMFTHAGGVIIPAPSVQAGGAALILPAAGAMLAGLRAIAASTRQERARGSGLSVLIGASVALQAAWALFGVLSGSHGGAVGAGLLAANLALTVPLLLTRNAGRTPAGNRQLAVGAASLLGLPPLGGFPGVLLIAQTAIDISGTWLAVLLLGSVLTAAAWLNVSAWSPTGGETPEEAGTATQPAPLNLLSWALLIAQLALFVLSWQIARML